MKKILNKILNYRLFNTKLGDKMHYVPAVFGKTIKSNWAYDDTEQINIFEYWKILWVNGISHYKNGVRIERIQRSYFYYIFTWFGKRITNLLDNILNIMGAAALTSVILKYFNTL